MLQPTIAAAPPLKLARPTRKRRRNPRRLRSSRPLARDMPRSAATSSIACRAVSGICNSDSPSGDSRMTLLPQHLLLRVDSATAEASPVAPAPQPIAPHAIEKRIQRQNVRTIPTAVAARRLHGVKLARQHSRQAAAGGDDGRAILPARGKSPRACAFMII